MAKLGALIVTALLLTSLTLAMFIRGKEDQAEYRITGTPLVGVTQDGRVLAGGRIFEIGNEGQLKASAVLSKSYTIKADRGGYPMLYTGGVVSVADYLILTHTGYDAASTSERQPYADVFALATQNGGICPVPIEHLYGTVTALRATAEGRLLIGAEELEPVDRREVRLTCFRQDGDSWQPLWRVSENSAEESLVAFAPGLRSPSVLTLMYKSGGYTAVIRDEKTGVQQNAIALPDSHWWLNETHDQTWPWVLWRENRGSTELLFVDEGGATRRVTLDIAAMLLECADITDESPGLELFMQPRLDDGSIWTSENVPRQLDTVPGNASEPIPVELGAGNRAFVVSSDGKDYCEVGLARAFALVDIDERGRLKTLDRWRIKWPVISADAADLDGDGRDELLMGIIEDGEPKLVVHQLK